MGQVFGRLTVIARAANVGNGRAYDCRCECGNIRKRVTSANLLRGNTKSCGCLRREVTIARSTTHGETRGRKHSPMYSVWSSIHTRCYNPECEAFRDYGGRGITMCDRWIGRNGFRNFSKDMSPRPPGSSIERIKNDRGYSPRNCKWATPKDQARNRRSNIVVSYMGKQMCLLDVAAAVGVNYFRLRYRFKIRGETLSAAIEKSKLLESRRLSN